MVRSKVCFGALAIAAMLVAGLAQAAVIGTATLVAHPPAVLYTTDLTYNTDPVLANTWVSYALGAHTTDGSAISGVDVTIGGILNQRWTVGVDPDTGDPVITPTPNSTNLTTADSHLTPAAGVITFLPSSEDNNVLPAPPHAVDTATRDYGVGTMLRGAWGYTAANQTSSVNFGYIVIPKGSEPNLNIHVELSTNPNQVPPLVVLTTGDFFTLNTPPRVDDGDGGMVMLSTNQPPDPTIIMHNFLPDPNDAETPDNGLTWAITGTSYLDDVAPLGGAGIFNPATIDGSGKLSWHADGSTSGLYKFTVRATDPGGLFDDGTFTVRLKVPEPASLALASLALVGLVGLIRRK